MDSFSHLRNLRLLRVRPLPRGSEDLCASKTAFAKFTLDALCARAAEDDRGADPLRVADSERVLLGSGVPSL